MEKNWQNYALVVKQNAHSAEVAEQLDARLRAAGWQRDDERPDVVIVVGGDGSMLFAVQKYLERLAEIVLIGMHTGTLGYFMDYTETEVEDFVRNLTVGRGEIQEFAMLQAVVGAQKWYAVNEVRIENPMRTQDVTLYLDGVEFENLRSSGLCVATQLGSTAYNRSLGGAILQEGMPALVLTEIAGIHHQKFKSLGVPYVMRDTTEITISANDFEGAYLGVDAVGMQLDGAGEVVIKKTEEKKLRMLRLRQIGHFERLRRML